MIAWVDYLGKAWGRYLRATPYAWPKQSAMWNVAFQSSSGASEISIPGMPPEILRFHRAWHQLDGKSKELLWNRYVDRTRRAKDGNLDIAHDVIIEKIIKIANG